MLVQLRTIERVLVHPRFNAFNLTNDVAIITLAEPAKMTKYVDIVCVAQQPVPPKTPCYVTGYGLQAVDKSKVTS